MSERLWIGRFYRDDSEDCWSQFGLTLKKAINICKTENVIGKLFYFDPPADGLPPWTIGKNNRMQESTDEKQKCLIDNFGKVMWIIL